jgi:hypothetical protein
MLLHYRPSHTGVLSTWKAERIPAREVNTPAGDTRGIPEHNRVTRATASPVRLVRADTDPVRLSRVWTSMLGALGPFVLSSTSSGTRRDRRRRFKPTSEAFSSLPESVEDPTQAGTALATAMVPGGATAAGLERELAMAESRKELRGIATVTDPSANADPLRELESEVAIAELEAWLHVARAQSAGRRPSHDHLQPRRLQRPIGG